MTRHTEREPGFVALMLGLVSFCLLMAGLGCSVVGRWFVNRVGPQAGEESER